MESAYRTLAGYCAGMSEENVEATRRSIEAYRRGDYAGATAHLAPDVVWAVGQEGPAHGPAAVQEMWERWDGDWDDLETVIEEVIDAGDAVIMGVSYRGRGRASGVEVNDRLYEVHTFRDGRCIRKVDFRERADALEAAGQSE